MFFKGFSYLRFLLKSTNQHGVHSPFVFDLITKCFYKKTNTTDIQNYKKFKIDLLQNTNTIEVTDFGAGSKVFKSNRRAIHKISRYAGTSLKRAKLLIRILNYFTPNTILEFGTSVGLGTAALHIGAPKAKITTLEGCENTAEVAVNQFKKFSYNNIQLISGEFKQSLLKLDIETPLDLVYFDGNHQKEATLNYFQFCLQHINNNSVFVFDDIHWSKSMEEAWEEIKKHPKVKVTIDTYQWGFVFFRKEQEKEHFIVRV